MSLTPETPTPNPAETVDPSADQRTGDPFADPATQESPEDKAAREGSAPFDRLDQDPSTVQKVTDAGAPQADGDHYRDGYFGILPDGPREDLSIAGVLGLNQDNADDDASTTNP